MSQVHQLPTFLGRNGDGCLDGICLKQTYSKTCSQFIYFITTKSLPLVETPFIITSFPLSMIEMILNIIVP